MARAMKVQLGPRELRGKSRRNGDQMLTTWKEDNAPSCRRPAKHARNRAIDLGLMDSPAVRPDALDSPAYTLAIRQELCSGSAQGVRTPRPSMHRDVYRKRRATGSKTHLEMYVPHGLERPDTRHASTESHRPARRPSSSRSGLLSRTFPRRDIPSR